jgi:hypothetical protein
LETAIADRLGGPAQARRELQRRDPQAGRDRGEGRLKPNGISTIASEPCPFSVGTESVSMDNVGEWLTYVAAAGPANSDRDMVPALGGGEVRAQALAARDRHCAREGRTHDWLRDAPRCDGCRSNDCEGVNARAGSGQREGI